MTLLATKLANIRLIAFDVDGIFTDGKLYYGEHGEALKAFHAHDGIGVKQLLKAGIEVAIITSRQSKIVEQRFCELGVRHRFQGVTDKLAVFRQLLKTTGIQHFEAAAMGDDLPDVPMLQAAGIGFTVVNAQRAAVMEADWQSRLPGGDGAVREVCELILAHQTTKTPTALEHS